jgi:hypothetical protein
MIQYDSEGRAFWNGGRIPRTTEICALLAPREWDAGAYYKHKGTLIHRITEWNDSGELDESSVDPALQGYLDAYRKFYEENHFRIIYREHSFIHLKYRYCGRVDIVGYFVRKNWDWAIDIKSGQPHEADKLQSPAYLFGEKSQGVPVQRCGDLYLRANGTYLFEEIKDPTKYFLHFLTGLKKWREENNGHPNG